MEQRYQTILVGVDGSAQANHAYRSAIEVAKRNDGKIIVVAAVQNNMYDFLNQAEKEYQDLLYGLQAIAKEANFTRIC
ncbi:MAG: universal stress protein [Streptococcaceae bacterium]|nr:universal stress protein [Streptococcaceae bacterium]